MEEIIVPKAYRVRLRDIVFGVFLGMWLFALSAGAIVFLLQATGDLPR